jgi:hypothetical protein
VVASARESPAALLARVPIDVVVRTGEVGLPQWSQTARSLGTESVRLAVARYAKRLARDLAVPAEPIVTVSAVPDAEIPKDWPFLMTIGEQAARVNLSRARGVVAEQATREVYTNRSLLLTPEVVHAHAARLHAERVAESISLQSLASAMRACVERNLSLERLDFKRPDWQSPQAWDARELVLSAHNEQNLGVSVTMSLERYRELTAGNQLNQELFAPLQARVFSRLGLLCPIPDTTPTLELGRDECSVKINDISLPSVNLVQGSVAIDEIVAMLEDLLLADPQVLLTREGVDRSLKLLRASSPELVGQALQHVGLNVICDLVEHLVREGIAARSMGRLLDVLTFARGTHQVDGGKYIVFLPDAETPVWKPSDDGVLAPGEYLRAARTNLKSEITHRYAQEWRIGSPPKMFVYLLNASLEDRIRETPDTPMSERERTRLLEELLSEIPAASPAIVLTTEEIRALVWSLIHMELPNITVLSYSDLSADCHIEVLAKISSPT